MNDATTHHRFPRIAGICLMITMIVLAACQKKTADSGGGSSGGYSASDTMHLAPSAQQPAHADSATTAVADTAPPVVTYRATLVTSMGEIVIDLFGKDAPKTVENFVKLAQKKYYDGVAFHRVIPGFMVQTGDPNSRNLEDRSKWGAGGESAFGPTFEDELNPATLSYRRGYVEGCVAMANAGPNTNGSQFFIVLTAAGAAHLPHSYTIFGAVEKGMDAVNKIGETGTTENPEHPAILKTVTVAEVKPATSQTASK